MIRMTFEEASNNWDEECAEAKQDEYEEDVNDYDLIQNEIDHSAYCDEVNKQWAQNEVINEGDEATDTEESDEETNGGARWIAFMGHIAHTELEYLKNEMAKLKAPYVMAAETAGYEHFHFLAKITERQYHTFAKRVFKDKFKLKGRWWKNTAGKNKPRQYGKVNKEIRDLSKMMSYTLKDKNFVTNMEVKDIETILKKKIDEVENTKDREIKDKMMEYVNNHIKEHLGDYAKNRHEKYIRIAIIRFQKEYKKSISRASIERYYWYYVANTDFEAFNLNEYVIYHELYTDIHA